MTAPWRGTIRVERRIEWGFVITHNGWLWEITRPDGTEVRSSSVFETLQQCGDDAKQHGYGAWKDDERRVVGI